MGEVSGSAGAPPPVSAGEEGEKSPVATRPGPAPTPLPWSQDLLGSRSPTPIFSYFLKFIFSYHVSI